MIVANETIAATLESSSWLTLVRVGFSFVLYTGYFVLGYWLADHAARVPETTGRLTTRIAAAAIWVFAVLAISVSWAIPLWQGQAPEALRFPWLPVFLLQLPLGIASFLLLAAWTPRRAVAAGFGRFADRCGLYAYGVYYIHPLIIIAVGLAWRFGLGLGATDALYYIIAFPLVSALSVLTIRSLAKLSVGRYLVG